MDEDEEVGIDATASKNYDLWWLAIFESGPTYNRYKSNGWTNGTVGQFPLSPFWEELPGWKFEPYHSYTVQFVVENRVCRNGIEVPGTWNVNNQTFFICPAGTGCRFGVEGREITLSPNPAGSFIRLQNFEPDLDRDYEMVIVDLTGKIVKSLPLTMDYVDISDLQNGMFVVNILREEHKMFTSKLIVNNR